MANLLDDPRGFHRPMSRAVIDKLVSALTGSTPTVVAKDFRFPLNRESADKIAAAINSVDTSGEPAITRKQLHDPWSRKNIERLKKVVI